MTREELLSSKEYWMAHIQSNLYAMIESYMKENNLKKKDIATALGVSKGYVSQILHGDFDHKISKLVDISLALKKIPVVHYEDLATYIQKDKLKDCFTVVQTGRPIEYHLAIDNAQSVEVSENIFKQQQLAYNFPQAVSGAVRAAGGSVYTGEESKLASSASLT